MMQFKKTFPLVFLSALELFFSISSHSQIQSFQFPPFKKITTEQGLSSNTVWSMMQDMNGFMWFATAYGLDRYDGYSFKIYNYNSADKNSFSAGWYGGMKQDKDGTIWIACSSEGFYSFNPATEKFVHYRHQRNENNSLSADEIHGFEIDSSGIIWLATLSGLDAFDPKKNSFSHFVHHNGDDASIMNNNVQFCMDDDENLLLAFAMPGLDLFNTKTGKVIQHVHLTTTSKPIDPLQSDVSCIEKGYNGNIWISTNNHGLFCYNWQSKTTRQYLHYDGDVNSIFRNSVDVTCEDHNGNVWVSSFGNGLDYFNHTSQKFYHAPKSYMDLLHDNPITQILEDKSSNIWIATENGIFLLDTKFKIFSCYRHQPDNKNSIASDYVSAFFRDTSGKLYVGSIGVDVFDDTSKTFSHFRILENGKDILSETNIWHIYRDRKGTLWFAMADGLISYDPQSHKHYRYRHDENDSTSLSEESCTGILQDRKGRYWVTTWGGGLDAFDPGTGKFRAFKMHDGPTSISTNSVGDLFEDSHGILYIGGQSGGLITFDPDTEIFKIYRHNPKDSTTISCDLAGGSCIETKSGIIWLATTGGGINAFNPSTKKFRAFTTKDGLSNDGVLCMIKDNNGNIWLGTHNGISCFTPPANPFDSKCGFRFRNYNMSDGLPSNEMNYFATYKDKDGKIFFGTTTAEMFYFYPDELKDNDYVPPVYITDLKLFNRSIATGDSSRLLSSTIETTKEIILKYDQNQISFSFAALNFIHPEKNQYAYKLDAFDKDWINTDAGSRNVYYTNLDPGEYVFEVKGSNNDAVWNQLPTKIHLVILPPFWQTWWFRSLIIIASVGLIYTVYRYRLQEVLHLQNIRNKIAGDLHDDIGSTLNSISIYSQVAQQDSSEHQHALEMIGEASRKIIESMSDIVWTINPDNDSFEKIIFRMRSLSYNVLHAKNIEFTFRADDSLNEKKLSMEERRNFYLIFKEVINNLVKYSGATNVMIALKEKNKQVQLIIHDNGVGFNIEQVAKGNGLNNMKRRAKEIEAELLIESTVGNGTNIGLTLKA
jgi:ligand-binding sensor domain-containing protein/signal transduction histidine kinase